MTLRVVKANWDRDRQVILAGAKLFIAEAGLEDFFPDTEDEVGYVIGRVVSSPNVDVFIVVDDEGKAHTGIGLQFGHLLWNCDMSAATEIFFWSSPDADKRAVPTLLRFVKGYLETSGVQVQIWAALSTSPAALDKVYRRMGMNMAQVLYWGKVKK